MNVTEPQARENLRVLIDKYNALTADERKQMSEASVGRQFIDRVLGDVLGWPVADPARFRYEQVTQVGRPDMMLIPEQGGTIFVEAKRFGVIKELKEARTTISGIITPGQMALPGMAVDRTPEEQQAINYAFANNGTWAILTNFEKLRLFNARRDWLVLSFETPKAYLDDFDYLWQLSYQNILTGSLDRLNNQRLTAEVDTEYLAFVNEWREKLALDLLQRREENAWAYTPAGQVDLAALRSVVQRIIDRMVIMRFAEDHAPGQAGTLRPLYEVSQNSYLIPLSDTLRGMFRRFDKIHNSALFEKGLADEAAFSDDALIGLMNKLYEARYRSMPPDIMGNTYEQYLGKTLVQRNGSIATADNLETRKKQGSYYTPQVIVRYIVDNSLGRYLYATENGKPDGKPIPGETRKTSAEIKDLRVLDSACGSGSFLIYAYEVLDGFYALERERLEKVREQNRRELIRNGITEPFKLQEKWQADSGELEYIQNPARLILETHLYGVDLDPQAAEIAVVNLMMRGMERRQQERRLPLILNQNVKVGNSLIGLRPGDPRLADHAAQIALIYKLRGDLIRTPNDTPEHTRIIVDLEAASNALSATLNAHLASEFADVSAVRPFHWGMEFPEVFFDANGKPLENPGFTIIFGNPPWEILKPDLREFDAQFDADIESKLNRADVEKRIAQLDAEEPRRREAFSVSVKTVEQIAAYVRSSHDYTRQGRGDVATHKLFLERMYGLLQGEGRLGYVVPSGIYTDLGTKELRQMLLDEGNIQYIFSFSNERYFFHGVDHRFKFALLGVQKGKQTDGFWSVFRFNPRVAVKPDELPDFLADQSKLIYVRRESLEKFSPDSVSVMEFQSRRDYEIAEKIYDDWPLLGEEPHPKSLSAGGEGLEGTSAGSPSPSTERGPGGEVHLVSREDLTRERWFTTPPLWDKLKALARQKRADPTPAEARLWEQLRNRQVAGLKFRRQHSIERFIVDFYCAEARLIVEVDGPIHDYTPDEDATRQAFLEAQGFRVLRFTNDAVLNALPSVIAQIATNEPHPKSLSAGGEGLKGASTDFSSLSTGREGLEGTPAGSPSPSTERGPGGEVPMWTVKFTREFDMTNDRGLFNTIGKGLPLYEGKMIHQFDAHYGEPQFWLDESQASKRLADKYQTDVGSLDYLKPRLAFRGIARSTDQRTLFAAILPPRVFSEGRTATTIVQQNITESHQLFLLGCLNSFALDWILRLKVAANINMFYMYQLPMPRLNPGNPYFDAIVPRAARLTCTRSEFADLWQSVMGEAWDTSKGATDPAERQRLRDEIDAIVAHLYGLSRDDFDHILGTFPLVFPESDAGRAKRSTLLGVYDAWAGKLPSP